MCCCDFQSGVKQKEFVKKLEVLVGEYGYCITTFENQGDQIQLELTDVCVPKLKLVKNPEDTIPEELKQYLDVNILETDCSTIIISR